MAKEPSMSVFALVLRPTWPVTNQQVQFRSRGDLAHRKPTRTAAACPTQALEEARRDYVIARGLGEFVQSLLIVALLGVIALFVALLSSQGEARFPALKKSLLPAWVVNRTTGTDQGFLRFDDTGIFPLIADNLTSTNPVHRAGAAILGWTATHLPALHYNRSSLMALLALGSSCIVLIALLAIWRRRVVAAVATDVATSLRRQVHRQMYRLGQSSPADRGRRPGDQPVDTRSQRHP